MNVKMSAYAVILFYFNSIFDHLHHGIFSFDGYIHQGADDSHCKHTHRMNH